MRLLTNSDVDDGFQLDTYNKHFWMLTANLVILLSKVFNQLQLKHSLVWNWNAVCIINYTEIKCNIVFDMYVSKRVYRYWIV